MKRGTSKIFEPIISKKKSRRFLKKNENQRRNIGKIGAPEGCWTNSINSGEGGGQLLATLYEIAFTTQICTQKSNSSLKEGFLPLSFLFTNLLTISKQRQMMLIQDDLMASVDRKYALKAFGVAKSLPGPICRSRLDLNNQYVQFSQYGPPWEMGRSHPLSSWK